MKLEIELNMSDRSLVTEHLGFWAINKGIDIGPVKVGMIVTFTHGGIIEMHGRIWKVEMPGQCIDPKWEYFREFVKIWYVPGRGSVKGIRPRPKADWTGVDPLLRIRSTPNRVRRSGK